MNRTTLILGTVLMAIATFALPSSFGHHVSTEIEVGVSPMKISLEGNQLFVSNLGEREISIIDTRTDEVIRTITTSSGVVAVEAVPEHDAVYAATFESGGVDVYELSSGKYIKTIDLPDSEITYWHSPGDDKQVYLNLVTGGAALDHNPKTGILYVANYNANYIATIDTRTNELLEKIPVSRHPYALKVDVETGKVLVANMAGNEITFLTPVESQGKTTHKISSTVKTGTVPWGIAIDGMEHLAYISHRGEHHITVLNIIDEAIVERIPVGDDTQAIAVDSNEHQIYVTYLQQNKIVKIDGRTNEIVSIIESGSLAWDLAVEPTSHKLYATMRGGDSVVVMGPESIASTIPIITMQTPVAYVGEMFFHGQDVQVIDATVDIENKALVLRTETEDGGKIMLSFPRTVLDSQDPQMQDKAFVIYADDKLIGHESSSGDENTRIVSIQVPKDTETVTLSGTSVIPEFGAVAVLVLVAGITAITIMSRKRALN